MFSLESSTPLKHMDGLEYKSLVIINVQKLHFDVLQIIHLYYRYLQKKKYLNIRLLFK